jgi:hypothetical protein
MTVFCFGSKISSVLGWYVAIFVKPNINKPRATSFSRETNFMGFEHELCEFCVKHTESIKDLEELTDAELYFYRHVSHIFFRAIRLLDSIRILIVFPSLDSFIVLYFTVGLNEGMPVLHGIQLLLSNPIILNSSTRYSCPFIISFFLTMYFRTMQVL